MSNASTAFPAMALIDIYKYEYYKTGTNFLPFHNKISEHMIAKTLYDLCNSVRKTLVSRELLPLNASERVHLLYLDEIADKTMRTIATIEAEVLGAPPGTRHHMTSERIAALREGLDDIREDTVRKGGSCSPDEWTVLWNREVEARNLLHDVQLKCRDRLWEIPRSPKSVLETWLGTIIRLAPEKERESLRSSIGNASDCDQAQQFAKETSYRIVMIPFYRERTDKLTRTVAHELATATGILSRGRLTMDAGRYRNAEHYRLLAQADFDRIPKEIKDDDLENTFEALCGIRTEIEDLYKASS